MKIGASVIVIGFCVLAACGGTKQNLLATWYFTSTQIESGERETRILVGILNQSLDPVTVHQVKINSTTTGLTESGTTLQSGEMRFWTFSSYKTAKDPADTTEHKKSNINCQLPVSVSITEKRENRPYNATMIATMPTSIPSGWERACLAR